MWNEREFDIPRWTRAMVVIERAELKRTYFRGVSTGRRLAPVHPGEVLLRDFIAPLGITRYKVAKLAGGQQRRIGKICTGQRAITGDTALRLARLFGTDAAFWINLQAQYGLEVTSRDMHERIEAEVTPLKMAV
jgi:antitoxin HigA-1